MNDCPAEDGRARGCRIALREVYKAYKINGTPVNAVNGVTLNAEPGEYVAIMGPSGSGKSTLLNLIGCLDRPTSGHVLVAGVSVDKMSEADLSAVRRSRIGFVFQCFELLPNITSVENVELPLLYQGVSPGERGERARRALKDVGLERRARHRPTQLSGGEQQRVAIARALVHRPGLVLADEPTGNLDMESGGEILSLLGESWEAGITLIMVTHDRSVAEHAQRIVHMSDGRLAGEETSGTRTPSTIPRPLETGGTNRDQR